MALWNHYHLPESVDEAIALLARYQSRARVVAGGTDLILELQQGRRPPLEALVDVTRIEEMTRVEESDGYIVIGAAVTHTAIVASSLLSQKATCLVESCGVIGGPQVRNVATLGGNVAHGLPAGDGTLSLVALDAEAEVALHAKSPVSNLQTKREWRPVELLFKGPGESMVDQAREVIVRFRFRPTGAGEASAFKRIMRPQGVALPILGMAAWLRMNDKVVDAARIALGPAGPMPMRARRAEEFLRGGPIDDSTLEESAGLILAEARLRTSRHRATSEYRRELVGVLTRRALMLAGQRARSGEAVPEGVGLS